MRFLKLLHFYILGRRWKIRTGKEDPANPRRNRALHIRVWKRKTERASGQTVFWSSCSQGRNRKNSLVEGLVCLFWWLWVIWHICRTSFTVEWHRNRHSSVGWCHSKHLNPFLITRPKSIGNFPNDTPFAFSIACDVIIPFVIENMVKSVLSFKIRLLCV